MAQTNIPVTTVTRAGFALASAVTLTPAGGAISGDTGSPGHIVINDGEVIVVAMNTDSISHTVTLVIAQNAVDGQTVANRSVTVPANTVMLIGDFPPTIYQQGATGTMYLNVDSSLVKFFAIRH
jgi:hypothetical protein